MKLIAKNLSLYYPIPRGSGPDQGVLKTATAKIGGEIITVGNRPVVRALNRINFRLEEGERLALIGHNGCGKSTLLKTLGGVYWPQEGEVIIDGLIDGVFDLNIGFRQDASGYKNIYIKGALLGKRKAEVDAALENIIQFTELEPYLKMPMRTYSTGMKLRFAFAVSTAFQQDILLLDEWIGTGDERFRQKVADRWNSFTEAAKILVIATHNLNLVEKIATKVMWLEAGTAKAMGPPGKILTAYRAYMNEQKTIEQQKNAELFDEHSV